jgi:hypothetical protein
MFPERSVSVEVELILWLGYPDQPHPDANVFRRFEARLYETEM